MESPKIKSTVLGRKDTLKKSRHHRNEEFEGSPINKPESYKVKSEQNNVTELLSIPFP